MVGNGAALLLPGPLKANAARLALGAGSQVLYNELTGTGVAGARRPRRAAAQRRAAARWSSPAGVRSRWRARSSTRACWRSARAPCSTRGGFTQAAGAVLRPTVTAASAGRVAAAGAVQLGGRLDVVAPVAVGGDVSVLTGAVAGTFAAVTGEYAPTYTAGGVTVRRPGGEEPKVGRGRSGPRGTGARRTREHPRGRQARREGQGKPKKPAKRKSKKAVKKKRR